MELEIFDTFMVAVGAIGFGVWLLVKGGDWTVDSAVYVAKKFGVSQLVIGFTILALGTSLPEFIVSLLSNLRGSPGIAIGNVLGSNIANIIFIVAFVAIMTPLVKKSKAIIRDLIFMLLVTCLFAGLLHYGYIGFYAGIGMLLLLISYIAYQYYSATKNAEKNQGFEIDADEDQADFSSLLHASAILFLGLVAVAAGAEFLVRGARIGALAAGVPESVIALSIIAFGTSLPELTTSISAARKGHSDMLFGNIIGSNVFNILLIIGAVSLIKPIDILDVSQQLVDFDIWVTLGVAVLFTLLLLIRKSIGKFTGIVMLSSYVLYNVYIYTINMGS